MALLMNRGRHNGPIRHLIGTAGAGTLDTYTYAGGRSSFNSPTARQRNLLMGEAAMLNVAGIPSGVRHPYAWVMPNKPGALASRSTVIGEGTASPSMQSGYNIAADVTGSGGVINTDVGLIISISAAILASGGISSAAASAITNMVANITGSGDIDATAAGLADLGAALTGAGVVVAGNTALMDIEANIRGYGDLTPEGLRDAVWSAILANYPDAGTAGYTLANAGAGGNPWSAVIENGMTAEEVLRIVAAALAGKVSGAGTGTETFVGLDGTTNRIVSTVDDNGNRSSVVVDGT